MTEHAFEKLVRTSLASAVEGAAPPPLAGRTRRRVRLRQGAFVGAAAMIVAAGSFGAVRAGNAVFADEGLPPAGPSGDLMDERGSGGTYPCDFSAAPGQSQTGCVAAGERGDVRWKLGAFLDPDHGLCLALEKIGGSAAAGAGSSCNEYEPGTIGLDQTGTEGEPMLAYGYVPGDTERLVLEHGAEDSFELEIYPAPDGFPLDTGFFLVWLPDDAVRFVAYDAEGDVLTTRPLDGTPASPEDIEYVDIASGDRAGVDWTLQAYGTVEDGREIACTRVLASGEAVAGLAPCDPSFGRLSAVGVTPFSLPDAGEVVVLGGVTSRTTGSVTFVTDDGRRVDAEMLDPPRKIEQTLRFFVAFVPSDDGRSVTGTVVVRDASGEVVEERDVCVPGGDGLSC